MSTSTAPAFSLLHDIVGNGHRAGRYAVMNPPSRDAKYLTVDQALTDDQLDAHVLGKDTYAAYIIGADGLVSGGCIELDTDALAGAGRVLAAAEKRGVTAFAIAVPGAGNHDGSHTWILFDQRVTPAAAAHLAHQIAIEAGYPDAEIRPTGAAIRLPFGVHTHSRKRGRLLLQSGEVYHLDDSDQFSMGAACVAALPKNPAPPEPPKVEPRPIKSVVVRTLTTGSSPIAQFNAAHTSEDLIERYGGHRTRDGWACNCGVQHSHTTQLQVLSEGGIVSYSPNCRWAPHYTSGKCSDAFGLYCLVEHGGRVKDAVKALLPEREPRVSKITFAEQPPKPSIDQAAAYNAARREKRHADNRQALETIAANAALCNISPRAQALATYLLDQASAAGVLQVRPTNAHLVEALDMCERYVIYAFRELEAAGLGKRHGGRGGLDRPNEAATFTFYRSPSLGCIPHQDAECTLVIDIRDPNPDQYLASERGDVPLGEADSPDTWAWCEDDHGADELNALEAEPVTCSLGDYPATQPAERMALVTRLERMTDVDLAAWIASKGANDGQMDGTGEANHAEDSGRRTGSGAVIQPAVTPRVVFSCGRWKAFDGQCYTWHTTREAANRAAGLALAPCPDAHQDLDDAPGASYDPEAPLPPADPRAVPSWLRIAGDIAMTRREDGQAEQVEQAGLFEPAAPRLPFIRPARAAQLLDLPPALRGWRPKHAAQARKARDALAALAHPRSQAKPTPEATRPPGLSDQPASEPPGEHYDAQGLPDRLRVLQDRRNAIAG
jgi:hypothetical protein